MQYARTITSRPFLCSLPANVGGMKFLCDLHDDISAEACFTGQYEPQETFLLKEILRPGMTFVDVGANWGYFTLVAASAVGATGQVISLEPDPRIFAMLERNMGLNCTEHVATLPLAAGRESAELTLVGYPADGHNWGISRLSSRVPTGGGTTFQVSARTLDSLLAERCIDQVDLVKIDIEGAEDLALEGMKEGIASGRYKRILLEVHPLQLGERGIEWPTILDGLMRAGYTIWLIDHSTYATRNVAYGRVAGASAILRPYHPGECDSWPHFLCLAPGESMPASPGESLTSQRAS